MQSDWIDKNQRRQYVSSISPSEQHSLRQYPILQLKQCKLQWHKTTGTATASLGVALPSGQCCD
jgi:hypothetical protein